MKQILLLSLLLMIVSSTVGWSQEPGMGPRESEWQRYTVDGEEFSVTLPAFPAMATIKVPRKADGKLRLERRLRTAFDGVYYSIEAFENPKPRQTLQQSIDELGLTSEFGFDPASKRNLTIDGFDAIEYSSSKNTLAAMVQFLTTEKHLYRFIAGGPDQERRAVKEFFSSIKLGKTPAGIEVSDGPGAAVQPPSTGEKIYIGKEVDVKARVLTTPVYAYTEDARKHRIGGIVVLKVVLGKSGQVENIRVVSGLPYGLTEQAIAAARKLKFTPAKKDGKLVSMWMQLEFNFIP